MEAAFSSHGLSYKKLVLIMGDETVRDLKIFSYNIHKGLSIGNFGMILDGIKKSLEKLDPDIVLLQEVQGMNEKRRKKFSTWPTSTHLEYLSGRTWPYTIYADNARYQHGHHGNAIMSKFPITAWKNVDISTNAYERRGLLCASVEVPGLELPLHLMVLHLDLLEKGRRMQAQRMIQEVLPWIDSDVPLLVAGDFNDWNFRVSAFLEKHLDFQEAYMEAHGRYPKTYPSIFPLFSLDRIYYRKLSCVSAYLLQGPPWSRLSDHLPLMADFHLG